MLDNMKLNQLKEKLYNNYINWIDYSEDTLEIDTEMDNLSIFVTANGIYQLAICEGDYQFSCNVFDADSVVKDIKRVLGVY